MKTLIESLIGNIRQTDKNVAPILIDEWMKKWTKSSDGSSRPAKYTVNDDGTIDFEGCLVLVDYFESEIPPYIKLNIQKQAKGYNLYDIRIENSALKTLKGLPKYLDHKGRVNKPSISIKNCPFLKDLEGVTKPLDPDRDSIEYKMLDCDGLRSLKGLPDKIEKGKVDVLRCNKFESMEGCPVLVASIRIYANSHLESLDGIRPGTIVKKDYSLFNNGARFSEAYCNSKIKLGSKKLSFDSDFCNRRNDDWYDYVLVHEYHKPPKDWSGKKKL